MAPQHLRISVGTTVTLHAAVSFWEPEFDSGILLPGQSFTHTFNTKGEFFYNDAPYPQNTGKITVA